MSSNSSTYYGPINETSSDIFLEKTFLVSGYLTGLGYGVQLVLYIACMRILWRTRLESQFTRFLLFYITILCSMNTIWTATSAIGLQLTFIDNRNYPGGVIAFLGVEFSMPTNVVSLAAYIVENILADGLLLWRCHVIWAASLGSGGLYLMILPTLVLLGSLSMGIAFAIETASPQGLFGSTTASFAIPYFAMTLALNVLLTLMIAGRIWYYQRSVEAAVGSEYAVHYTTVTTMFVESAAIYTVVSLLLLVTFIVNNPINQIWLGIAPSVQLITSYLIIYRVAEGRAWTSDTITNSNTASSPIFRRSNFTTTRGSSTQDGPDSTMSNLPLTHIRDKSETSDKVVQVVRPAYTSSNPESAEWKSVVEV